MKKIMIAAIAAGMCTMASAYTMDWALAGGEFADWKGETIGTESAAVTCFLIASQSSDAVSFKDGAWVNYDSANIIDTRQYSDDLGGFGSAYDDTTFTSSNPVLGKDPQYFQLVIAEGTVTDLAALGEGKHFYLFDSVAVAGEASTDPDHPGIVGYVFYDTDSNITQGGWQTVAVPEPTSGLLLLLGVAGFALRRRRA